MVNYRNGESLGSFVGRKTHSAYRGQIIAARRSVPVEDITILRAGDITRRVCDARAAGRSSRTRQGDGDHTGAFADSEVGRIELNCWQSADVVQLVAATPVSPRLNRIATGNQLGYDHRRQTIIERGPGVSAGRRNENADVSANIDGVRVLRIDQQTVSGNIWQVAADVGPGAAGVGGLEYVGRGNARDREIGRSRIGAAQRSAWYASVWQSG